MPPHRRMRYDRVVVEFLSHPDAPRSTHTRSSPSAELELCITADPARGQRSAAHRTPGERVAVIETPPGLPQMRTAKTFAAELEGKFCRIEFTPIFPSSDNRPQFEMPDYELRHHCKKMP